MIRVDIITAGAFLRRQLRIAKSRRKFLFAQTFAARIEADKTERKNGEHHR